MIKLIIIISLLCSLTTLAIGKSPYTPNNQLTMPSNSLEAIDTTTLKQEFKKLSKQMIKLGERLCNSNDTRSLQYTQDYYELQTLKKRHSKIWVELLLRNSKS